MYRPIFLFVEGSDDITYFENIIKPHLEPQFGPVLIVAYKQMAIKELRKYIKSAVETCRSTSGIYWLFHDKDDKPCITRVKEAVLEQLGDNIIDERNILVIEHEIESWFIAGKNNYMREARVHDSDTVTKELFEQIAAKDNKQNRHEAMIAIVPDYKLSTARTKNTSLNYCSNKLGI